MASNPLRERVVVEYLPVKVGTIEKQAQLTVRVQTHNIPFVGIGWSITVSLRFENVDIIRIELTWRKNDGGYSDKDDALMLDYISKHANIKLDALRGIGQRAFCRVLLILAREWPFMLQHGNDTMIHVMDASNDTLVRYYETYGFTKFSVPDSRGTTANANGVRRVVSEVVRMKASVQAITEKCMLPTARCY